MARNAKRDIDATVLSECCSAPRFGERVVLRKYLEFSQTETAPLERLSQMAGEAKASGETHVDLPPLIITPTGVDDLTTIAKEYSVVVATPLAAVTVPTRAGLGRWIKFRKTETIVLQNTIDSTDVLSSTSIPSSFVPSTKDEFVLFLSGGSLTVDGVLFEQKPARNISFRVGQTYLLFLYFDSGGKRALLPAMDRGIFSVDAAGVVTPAIKSDSKLIRQIQTVYKNDLTALRPALKDLKTQ